MDNQKLQVFLKSFYARVFEGSEFAGEGSIAGNIRNFIDSLLKDLGIYDEVSYIWNGGAKKSGYFTVTIGNSNYDELNEAKVKVKIALNKDKTISYGLSNDSGESKGIKGFKEDNYKTVSIDQINYNDILDEVNKYKKNILEDINSEAIKSEDNIKKMDNQTFVNGFKNIYNVLEIFRKAKKDDGATFVEELNKIEKKKFNNLLEYYGTNGDKVRKIRVDIIKTIMERNITLDDVERIKDNEKKNYEHNILQSRKNFSILYFIYYYFYRDEIKNFLENLQRNLIDDLGMSTYAKYNVVDLDGAQNFGLDGFWTAIYHNSHKSQKTALQLNIDSKTDQNDLGLDKIAIGMGHGPEYHGGVQSIEENFDLKELTYERTLKEFQKYKDLILQDIYLESNSGSTTDVHYRVYAPGENARKREEFYSQGIMGLGWDELGDLRQYKNKEEIADKLRELDGTTGSKKNNANANYDFKNTVSIGDIIIPKRGRRTYLGYGIVEGDYTYDDTLEEYKSIRKVKWIKKGEWNEDAGGGIVVKTLTDITKYPSYVEELQKLLGILSPSSKAMGSTLTHLNTILYGAPGTGKTYSTINHAISIIEGKTLDEIGREERIELKERFDEYKKQGQIVFCSFHQSLSYEEFIEGIKANTDEKGNISYDIEDGIFKEISKKAIVKSGSNIEEVIEKFKEACDEANGKRITIETATTKFSVIYKGGKTFRFSPENTKNPDVDYPINIDNIKGVYTGEKLPRNIYNGTYSKGILDYMYKNLGLKEYTTLEVESKNYVLIIDEINRGNMSKIFGELITLLEPSKRIGAEEELKVVLPYSQEEFGVPSNLYVVGTMNTADRSIALIDIALRRRFTFKEMEPDSSLLSFKVGNIDIQKMFETINQRIEFLYDRDHRLGHSFFLPLKGDNSLAKLNQIFLDSVIPLLQEYFYEDWGKIQIVLGDHPDQWKKMENKIIQEINLKEKDIIGFDHDDLEDKYAYKVNNSLNEAAYTGIYDKTKVDAE